MNNPIKQLKDWLDNEVGLIREGEPSPNTPQILKERAEVLAEVSECLSELDEYLKAKEAGTLQIINKDVFCRRAHKQKGRCAGYHENMYSTKPLAMCEACADFDPDADNEDDYSTDFACKYCVFQEGDNEEMSIAPWYQCRHPEKGKEYGVGVSPDCYDCEFYERGAENE